MFIYTLLKYTIFIFEGVEKHFASQANHFASKKIENYWHETLLRSNRVLNTSWTFANLFLFFCFTTSYIQSYDFVHYNSYTYHTIVAQPLPDLLVEMCWPRAHMTAPFFNYIYLIWVHYKCIWCIYFIIIHFKVIFYSEVEKTLIVLQSY